MAGRPAGSCVSRVSPCLRLGEAQVCWAEEGRKTRRGRRQGRRSRKKGQGRRATDDASWRLRRSSCCASVERIGIESVRGCKRTRGVRSCYEAEETNLQRQAGRRKQDECVINLSSAVPKKRIGPGQEGTGGGDGTRTERVESIRWWCERAQVQSQFSAAVAVQAQLGWAVAGTYQTLRSGWRVE